MRILMGLFDSIFGSSEDAKPQRWSALTSEEDVDHVTLSSNERPQVILKHSNSCGISFFAKKNLDAIPEDEISVADFYIIDVIRNRNVSLYLADTFNIRHESPQLFVLKNGEVIWHGSHNSVNAQNLIQALG